jgi:predicted ATPase
VAPGDLVADSPTRPPTGDSAAATASPYTVRLPEPLTSFVGRERELREIRDHLESARLLTLTGAGGIGKTRLALQVARGLADEGTPVAFADLAPLGDAALVPQVVARSLGIGEQRGRPIVDALIDSLAPRRLVVVLDNCEHLIDACCALVAQLLRACPGVRVVATSRELLRTEGELNWRVPSLAYRMPARSDLGDLPQVAAVALFVERARAHRPDFELTGGHLGAVADICKRLEGIPLAIELAAACVTVLSPEQIAARLDDCFRLLTQGSRLAPHRQQTLRAALDWSHDLLSENERSLFRRLSAFAGGWTLDAVEAVCAWPPLGEAEVLYCMTELVSKSLVLAEPQLDGTMRYRLLETVRQYAAMQLESVDEQRIMLESHARYYLKRAEGIEETRTNDWRSWRGEGCAWLTVETANIRAVLGRRRGGVVDAQAEDEIGLRLCASLFMFWCIQDRWQEAWETYVSQLDRSPPRVTPAWFWARFYAGITASILGDFRHSEALLGTATALAEELEDGQLIALGHGARGQDLVLQGRLEEAQEFGERALALARDVGPRHWLPFHLFNLGWTALRQGRLDASVSLLDEAIDASRHLGDDFSLSIALPLRASAAVLSQDMSNAWEFLLQAEDISRSLPNAGLGTARIGLGRLALLAGKLEQATKYFRGTLDDAVQAGRRVQVCESLEGLALVADARKDGQAATRLLAAVEAERKSLYRGRAPDYRGRLKAVIAKLRLSLGVAEFELTWRAGERLSLNEAVLFARETTHDRPSTVERTVNRLDQVAGW